MSAYYSGSDGWMYVDSGVDGQVPAFSADKKVAAVTKWALQTSMRPIESTTLGDTDTVFTPGTRTTTGSCTVFYYSQASGGNKAAFLFNKLSKQRTTGNDIEKQGIAAKPEKVVFKLGLNDATATERFIYVRAYLTSVSTGLSVGDVMKVDVQFRVIGAPNQISI